LYTNALTSSKWLVFMIGHTNASQSTSVQFDATVQAYEHPVDASSRWTRAFNEFWFAATAGGMSATRGPYATVLTPPTSRLGKKR
jgi:hypothetical protein